MTPKTERAEIATKPVVYQISGMEAVIIQRDIAYQTTGAGPLGMDLHSPPDSKPGARLPAFIFVTGYSDVARKRCSDESCPRTRSGRSVWAHSR